MHVEPGLGFWTAGFVGFAVKGLGLWFSGSLFTISCHVSSRQFLVENGLIIFVLQT